MTVSRKLSAVHLVAFKNASLANLMTYVNAYTSGQAVTAPNSGTVAYAAGDVGERMYVGERSYWDGTSYVMILYYAG